MIAITERRSLVTKTEVILSTVWQFNYYKATKQGEVCQATLSITLDIMNVTSPFAKG